MATATAAEVRDRFACFGGEVTVLAAGEDEAAVRLVVRIARSLALDAHRRLTRFDASSELCRLNADPRPAVPASALLCGFAEAVRRAGALSDGLVDATCLPAVEAAGYREHWEPGDPGAPRAAGAAAAPLAGDWRAVGATRGAVRRPPGVRLDSGGLGKGLAADRIADALAGCATWAVVCGGDLRLGGTAGAERTVEVTDPFDEGRVIHRLALRRGAVATSGTTRRRWAGGHHLIDPRTGRPAETGIVQATAVAPTGLEAEVRAKAALLAGPGDAARHLPGGGVLVGADGRVRVVEAA